LLVIEVEFVPVNHVVPDAELVLVVGLELPLAVLEPVFVLAEVLEPVVVPDDVPEPVHVFDAFVLLGTPDDPLIQPNDDVSVGVLVVSVFEMGVIVALLVVKSGTTVLPLPKDNLVNKTA
jgi:hypothetical protein